MRMAMPTVADGTAMSARFEAGVGMLVFDRRDGSIVAECGTHEWAEMVADGLNMIVDQVAPWSPGAAYGPVVDGEVIELQDQKAIGWHDEPLSGL